VKVGIGTSSPLDKLDVNGDIRIGTGTTGCVKDRDGTVITGTCASDVRLKRNIEPFAPVLQALVQLQPVHFDWSALEHPELNLGNTRSFGLIAQEVETVLPELVTEDERGFKAVKYNQLPLYLLQAIREVKAQNDYLATELDKLRRTVNGKQ
jgi:endosialidase-like protein